MLQTVADLTGSEENNVSETSHPEYRDTENRVSKEPPKNTEFSCLASSLTRPDSALMRAHHSNQPVRITGSATSPGNCTTTTGRTFTSDFDGCTPSLLRGVAILQGRVTKYWSGREDSNLRPLDPQSSALPGCATPRKKQLDYTTRVRLLRFSVLTIAAHLQAQYEPDALSADSG